MARYEVPRLPAPSDTGPTAEERNQGSIQEAVRHALTGESVRVALKKDYQKLVTDGAEVGYAVVDHDGERSAITLPNGTHEHTGDGRPPAAVSFCREQLHAVIRSLEDAERIASEADFQTERAAVLHKDIQQWDRIGSALAPDGIPGELLAEALGPINERLARSSSIADWLRIGIQADMTIAADGGRPCHDCKHFVAWLDKEPAPRIDCPGDYNPCTKGHMKFMAPEHYGDDYGFYLRVCHDRELLEAEE
jgi:hypothetical protein